jgi:hypothetical protein
MGGESGSVSGVCAIGVGEGGRSGNPCGLRPWRPFGGVRWFG